MEKGDPSAQTWVKWTWAFKTKDIRDCNKLNEKLGMRIHPNSVKLDIKEIDKNVRQYYYFQYLFLKIIVFY